MRRLWVFTLIVLLTVAALADRRHFGVLVVYAPSDLHSADVVIAVMNRLQKLRSDAGYSKQQMPFRVYYFDRPDEMRACERLGITAPDLPFLGVVQLNADGDPSEVLNRTPRVHDASIADATFARAESLLGLTPTSPSPVAAGSESPAATASAFYDDHPQLSIEDVSVDPGPKIHIRAVVDNTGESTAEGPLHLNLQARPNASAPWGPVADQVIEKVPREWKLVREVFVDSALIPEAPFQLRVSVVLPNGQEVGTRVLQVLPPGSRVPPKP